MLDLYGAGIVWRYGVAHRIPMKKTKAKRSQEELEKHLIETKQINEEYLLFKKKSQKGFDYIFFGFSLQLVSIFISWGESIFTQ